MDAEFKSFLKYTISSALIMVVSIGLLCGFAMGMEHVFPSRVCVQAK